MKSNDSIKISGKEYIGNEIIELCNSKLESGIADWEKEIFTFISEWFNHQDYVQVSTSGSTGTPKIISLKKVHIKESALSTIRFFDLKENDNAWLCLPMKYIASKLMVVRAIIGKINLIYSEPGGVPIISTNNIDFAAMVPFQVSNLLETQIGIATLKKIKKLLIGGSSIPDNIEVKLIANAINTWHSYGMTETITHIALRKIGSETRYIPLEGATLSVTDHNQLLINYPSRGIINMITNDIVKLEKDQSFYVVGRIDNVIITGGVKVQPEKIEDQLNEIIHENFFVGGIDDEKLGQKVVLFVENPEKRISLERINKLIGSKLSKYEIPKELIVMDKFVYTHTSKISRKNTIKKIQESRY